MATPILPKAQSAIAGSLPATREWLDFFRDLLGRVNDDEALAAEIAAIILRLETLEGAEIIGTQSVQVFGSLSAGLVNLLLRGDEPIPSPLFYYGTDPVGNKGWQPAASLVEYMVDENGDYLVDENGNFLISVDITADLFAIVETLPGILAHTGVGTWEARTLTEGAGIDITDGDGVAGNPTIAHEDTSSVANLTSDNSGTVVLQDITFTFDTFGHVLTATVGTVDVATALTGTFEPAIAAGTTGQFWRGDKTFTNRLTTSGAGQDFVLEAYGGATRLVAMRAGGTSGAPTAVTGGSNLFIFALEGYDGTGFFESSAIQFTSTETWSTTAHGTQILFRTTTNATTTETTRWEIFHEGTFRPATDNTYNIGSSARRVSALHGFNLHQYGARFETGVVTPTQLVANTDNWAVAGLGTAGVIRASTDASRNLTGIASPTSGQSVLLVNVGAFDLVLVHDATSTAANRFLCPNSANLTLNPNDSVRLWYDNTSSRWRAQGT